MVFMRRALALVLFILAGVTPAEVRATGAAFCVGDCNGDGMVTVDELIRGINIALGTLSVDDCPVFDSSGEGMVTVDEIVTAVANGLNGCPAVSSTPTPTMAPSATPTATQIGPVPVRVLAVTDGPFGNPNTIITSLGTPIISPLGFVVVTAELTEGSSMREALLRLSPDGGRSILLQGGQAIPNSGATVGSISQANAKSNGVFAFVDAATGASLLQIVDTTITPVIGLGASGARADFESRMFAVPTGGGSVVADVFGPGGMRGIVAIPLGSNIAPIVIASVGDTLSYRNNEGVLVNAMALGFGSPFAATGAGTARLGLEPELEAVLAFSFDEDMLLDRQVPLVEGNQAPGVAQGTTFSKLPGVTIGGMTGSVRGFLADLEQSEFPGVNESAVFITDPNYVPLFVFQAGAPVPDAVDATIDSPDQPAMGLQAAAVSYDLVDDDDIPHEALGFVDYETPTFNTVAVAGEPAPGGGEFAGVSRSYAINENGVLVFRAGLGGNQAAYYAASTTNPAEPVRRLVGTGDTVAPPEGGSATITALGLIPATSGLGGEATAVGAIHFTVSATLDNDQGAILLVEIGD